MAELELVVEIDGVKHPKWAFDQGMQAGIQNRVGERGLMGLGLTCAATELDARNTRGWIAGFDAGQILHEQRGTISTGPGALSDFDKKL